MKKWLALLGLIILFSAGFFYFKKPNPAPTPSNVLSANEVPSPTPQVWKQSTVINGDNVPIRISWAVAIPSDVELYSNLKDQQLSEQIKAEKSCSVLVNGGFYSTENNHLGLFISNFETISRYSQSDTRNGFLWIKNGNVSISGDVPENNPRIALQSGPLLMLNGESLPLKINNDKPDRRIAAGVTSDNMLIFWAIYRDTENLQGPMLGKLPEIIEKFKKQTGIDIVEAINLDGGSASVFVSNYDLLRELTYVGSYFCSK